MGRRKKWTARPFESQGQKFTDPNTGVIRSDTSANLYESMLLHPAFTTMKPRQQVLYLICKAQFYGHRKPRDDFKEMEDVQSDECFYLNLAAVIKYGNYTRNMRREFYADMAELERRGFIKTISSGRATKSKSIYRFCSDWKSYNPC